MILRQVAELAIFSEGAVSYTEAWQLSPDERDTLIKTLNRYNKIKSGDKGANYDGDDWGTNEGGEANWGGDAPSMPPE